MNSLNLNNEHRLIKYFIIFGWISCWFSVSFNPEFFYYPNIYKITILEEINYIKLITFLRGASTLILFPILIYILIILNKKKNLIKSNFIFLALTIFFIIQLVGFSNTNNPKINIYYLVSSLDVVIICLIIKNFFTEKELLLVFNITFIILISIFAHYSIKYINIYIENPQIFTLYSAWGEIDIGSLISEIPRPTGLARVALIVLITSIFLLEKKNNYNFFYLILINATGYIIITLGSRTILFLFILFLIFYIFYNRLYNSKKIFNLLSNCIFIPIILIIVSVQLQKLMNDQSKSIIKQKHKPIYEKYTSKLLRDFPSIKIDDDDVNLDTFSSGRFEDWKNIINKNPNLYYGVGVMGDRYLINQSASNLILYSYASSGILGVILIICISLNVFFQSILIIIKSGNFYLKKYKLISVSCLILLMLRSILETSYGVFGIDLILFCFFSSIISFKKRN
ncbi:hypothetical protein N9T21_00670 [Candidatus Pelagibacter sp.]|nr:hypothetical protein [Candidatus Pelagibacter sp.]